MSERDTPADAGPGDGRSALERRKDAHLDLVLGADVERRGPGPLFDDVRLVHCALPELALDAVDTRVTVLGKTLKFPLMVTGMTGGTARAGTINRDLARAAERAGVAFGVGSQRAMAVRAESTETFAIRDVAPDLLLFGNVGAQQVVELGPEAIVELGKRIGADGVCVHLNPAQELAQPGGDRDFSGCLDAIRRLADRLGPRTWVKETGCGLSRQVASKLVAAGVGGLDVSGAGGTSWPRVEELRSSGADAALGAELGGWGIPTAAAVAACADLGVPLVASGGVRSGGDVVRALALGAALGGIARPVLVAWQSGGVEAVTGQLGVFERSIRAHLLLCGARDVAAMRSVPRALTGELPAWIQAARGAP